MISKLITAAIVDADKEKKISFNTKKLKKCNEKQVGGFEHSVKRRRTTPVGTAAVGRALFANTSRTAGPLNREIR